MDRELTMRVHFAPGKRSILVRVITVPNPGWTMHIEGYKYVVTEVCQTPSIGRQCHSLDVTVKPYIPED